MKRFLSNYIYCDGKLWRNHIATIDDSDLLVSLEPIENEPANTYYAANPLCIINCRDVKPLLDTFRTAPDRNAFQSKWQAPRLSADEKVAVYELNFKEKFTKKLS